LETAGMVEFIGVEKWEIIYLVNKMVEWFKIKTTKKIIFNLLKDMELLV
jgi:hypothetical protein